MREIGFIIDLFLSYVENMINYIGHSIVSLKETKGSIEVSKVAKILQDMEFNLNEKHKDMLVSAMFDFITPNGDTVASTMHGVISPPKKVDSSRREYIKLGRQEPWKLHICKMDIGITIEEVIIPVAIGITDKDNNFLGYVTSGIRRSKLKKRLSEIIQNENYSFILLNNDLDFILYSEEDDKITDKDKNTIKLKLDSLRAKEEKFGTLDETIFIDGTEYIFYTKTNDYPFIIIIGIKRKNIFNLKDLEKKMIELEKEGNYHQMFLFALLYMFQDKIINPIIGNKPYHSNFKIPKVFSAKINDLFLALEQMEGFMEIKIQKEVAEESKKVREKFFRAVLHDLKNPTGVIDNLLELVKSKSISAKEALEMMKGSVSNIMNIVNSLQLITQIESGSFKLNKTEVDLKELIDGISEAFKFDLKAKDLYLKAQIETPSTIIFADRQLMSRILTNLLFNAIKFTSEGGITIIVKDEGDKKVIIVKDTGCGIKDECISHILKGEAEKTDKDKNSLLFSLSVIKKFVEQHNGVFLLKSKKDKGTEVIMKFKKDNF